MPRKSGRTIPREAKHLLAFAPPPLGHSSPGLCPTPCPRPNDTDPLGAPLSIGEVATLIGSSVWTVRQKYLPLGLPHFRVGPTGKLLFYKKQIIRWLISQQKGVK
ncbi:MAG TPA: hypothetical protein VGR73_07915 [Bryobacteraceae bacterium]|nr:hypothetical protein [Bryobacteraceae bacterium]